QPLRRLKSGSPFVALEFRFGMGRKRPWRGLTQDGSHRRIKKDRVDASYQTVDLLQVREVGSPDSRSTAWLRGLLLGWDLCQVFVANRLATKQTLKYGRLQ